MTKKIFLISILLLSLFAFESKYLPNYNIDIKCDKILHKKAFDICYSCKWKTPKMVVYQVDGNLIDSKNLSRKHLRFKPDYQLPTKCRSYSKDYSKTGFDRGHLAPNAVFDYDRKVQKETFLMSNIAPQKPKLNRRLWTKIERFVRLQARKYRKISVITGVCGSNGTLGKKRHNVNIPKWWYKIIFLPNGKTICFLVPNINTEMSRAKAKEFLVQIENIERICNISIRKE
ncbi:DNA/RNA non-specific endonuclease [Nitrosophilus labii]|uniref:DNA/RNA non-specific endonuclease n=1 Tax=Nitrosophilus labii TaxID=2706014 RepID=UPI00165746B1|nr:DNA/RNA non-specific endonuclease [Nitrosophilus labii]